MTLTNVEKELIATQIHDLDKSFERVVTDQRKDKSDPLAKPELLYQTYLEHLQATRAVIKDLKKYWVERQQ